MRVPFYFDYTCPWAYLGSSRVETYFGDLPIEIEFKPIHLGTIREPMVGPKPEGEPQKLGPRKRHYGAQDMANWAEFIGAEFGDRSRLVRADTRLILKAALVAKAEGRFAQFHYPAFRARWVEGTDVSLPETVRGLLAEAGLDADACLPRALSAELDAELAQENDAAMARGVFGVPTMVVGHRLFWGNDRFEMVRHYIVKSLQQAAA
jgi:2-hydroxychromene-2-carboxylate isomerase